MLVFFHCSLVNQSPHAFQSHNTQSPTRHGDSSSNIRDSRAVQQRVSREGLPRRPPSPASSPSYPPCINLVGTHGHTNRRRQATCTQSGHTRKSPPRCVRVGTHLVGPTRALCAGTAPSREVTATTLARPHPHPPLQLTYEKRRAEYGR